MKKEGTKYKCYKCNHISFYKGKNKIFACPNSKCRRKIYLQYAKLHLRGKFKGKQNLKEKQSKKQKSEICPKHNQEAHIDKKDGKLKCFECLKEEITPQRHPPISKGKQGSQRKTKPTLVHTQEIVEIDNLYDFNLKVLENRLQETPKSESYKINQEIVLPGNPSKICERHKKPASFVQGEWKCETCVREQIEKGVVESNKVVVKNFDNIVSIREINPEVQIKVLD